MPFDAVLMDMQMPDIDGLEATRRIRADGRFAGLPIGHDRQRLAGRPRSLPAAGMNDHVAKPIDKAPGALSARSSRQERRQGAGNDSGRGRTGRGAGRYRRRFGGSLELIVRCCGASFRICRTSSPSSNASSARAMSGQRRDPAYHQGQRVHRWRQRPGRPCQRAGAGPAPRRPLRGMEILAGIRLDELRTLCDACLLACRRCSATCRRSRRAEPGAVASPARIQADPGLACTAAAL